MWQDEAPAPRRWRQLLTVVAVVLILVVLLGLLAQWSVSGPGSQPLSPAPPPGWHAAAILPGTYDTITYAISPDVPGLVLALTSNYGPDTGALYRSHDFGATWQALSAPFPLSAISQLEAPAGGQGTYLVSDMAFSDQGGPLELDVAVTHDVGSTWSAFQIPLPITALQAPIHGTIYRDGALYGLIPEVAQPGESVFAVSHDDGQTWTSIEAAPSSNTVETLVPAALAPDEGSKYGWYRLSAEASAAQSQPESAPLTVQHSSDGGRTWHTVSTVGPLGPQIGQEHSIVTSPGAPRRLCVATTPNPTQMQASTGGNLAAAMAANTAKETALITPTTRSVTVPFEDGLYASADGGHTWVGGTIATHSGDFGTLSQVEMGADGTCYVLDTSAPYSELGCDKCTATIWKLGPADSAPVVVTKIAGLSVNDFALVPAQGTTPARLMVSFQHVVDTTSALCHFFRCASVASSPLRLAWMDVP